MRDPKGTAGAGEEMKQRREMLKVGYQQSPHFAMDDDSRSIDHWRKFFDNTGLDIFELIENAVYVARMDYPKEFISKQQTKNFVDPSQDHVNPSMLDEEIVKQTIPQGIVNKLGKPFTTHSRPGKNLSLLSIPKQENQTCEIQTKPSVVEDNKTKQPKKEINQASLERAKRKLKEGYQQAEIDEYFFDGVEATMFVVDQLSLAFAIIVSSLLRLDPSSVLEQVVLELTTFLWKEKTSLTKLTVHRHGGVNVVGFVKWLQQDGVFASFPTSSPKISKNL
ncbi:hypothetical protein HPP92_011828 [Vanilla planifolia]|uniref:Uncharacterized protein n=1 Tax=Vanilla planifolia TaxID=51239 RepID=A0A835V1H1_VANPL|nr:hypothetical protein HPP92_012171 [Vanilla planifolia]KAG0483744.1 hypothetical protein HPP92_011828 [Vanilla planifolia]